MDGIPDSCDNCPYLFNPDQHENACPMKLGVCPYDRSEEGILWTETAAGKEDERPCPPPLSGIARRLCNSSGQWENAGLALCLTAAGRQLREMVSTPTTGAGVCAYLLHCCCVQLNELRANAVFLSDNVLVHLATQLGVLTSSTSNTAADLQISSLLLTEILSSHLFGSRAITELTLQSLVAAVSNMTTPSHTDQWRVVEGNTSAAISVLISTELLTKMAPKALQPDRQSLQLWARYASLRTERRTAAQFSGLEWSVVGGGSISIPRELVVPECELSSLQHSCNDVIVFSLQLLIKT